MDIEEQFTEKSIEVSGADTAVLDNGRCVGGSLQKGSGATVFSCATCGSQESLKLLPCLHIFCVSCIESEIISSTSVDDKKPGDNVLASCITCGHKVTSSNKKEIIQNLKDIPDFLYPKWRADHVLNGENQNNTSVKSNNNQENQKKDKVVCDKDQKCSSCQVIESEQNLHQCCDCGLTICASCASEDHAEHSTAPLLTFIESREEYITSLLSSLKMKHDKHMGGVACISRVKECLYNIKQDLEEEIIERATYLNKLIENQKNFLLAKVTDVIENHIENYTKAKDNLVNEMKQFSFITDFGKHLLDFGCSSDVTSLQNDVANQCLHHLHQIPDASVDIVSLKLDIPGRGKEHTALEKLFGSLTEGVVHSGKADLLATFNVDMKWPTSIAVSPSKEIVVSGKCETFESNGKAIFFDSRGVFHSKVNFDHQHLPLDVQPAGDGTVWLSNNCGELLNMSVAGRILRRVPNVFQGSGQLALLNDGSLIVASENNKLLILDELGALKKTVHLPVLSNTSQANEGIKISSVVIDSNNHIIVSESQSGQVFAVDQNGHTIFTYKGYHCSDFKEYLCSDWTLKCPSAICCDPFDNILVADFTNDNIHFLSKTGQFLGCLLTKTDGISCPNCLALDQEGRLYVGQYGGDVLVYRYHGYKKSV